MSLMSQQKSDAGILANAPSSIRQLFFVANANSNLMKQPRECMEIITTNIRQAVTSYLASSVIQPLLLHGDALVILKDFLDESIDMAMTSPPYWQKRQYSQGGIGLERDYPEYIAHLCAIVKEVYRILKPTGSFWLNIGDSYKNKHLLGIPWRVAFEMMDHQGWILRNNVIWNKIKGSPAYVDD